MLIFIYPTKHNNSPINHRRTINKNVILALVEAKGKAQFILLKKCLKDQFERPVRFPFSFLTAAVFTSNY
jgi:hypothetical protein